MLLLHRTLENFGYTMVHNGMMQERLLAKVASVASQVLAVGAVEDCPALVENLDLVDLVENLDLVDSAVREFLVLAVPAVGQELAVGQEFRDLVDLAAAVLVALVGEVDGLGSAVLAALVDCPVHLLGAASRGLVALVDGVALVE
jgi:hypothetical protein